MGFFKKVRFNERVRVCLYMLTLDERISKMFLFPLINDKQDLQFKLEL